MTSRKPDLTLPLPERPQPDFQTRSTTSLRSPRFTENFDVPFSEAIMNASSATLATDYMTFPSSSSNDRASFGDEPRSQPPLNRNDSGSQSPTPLPVRHSSWESELKRRANVNARIREWARKSWSAVRSRPETRNGYFESNHKHSRSSAALSPSSGSVSPAVSDGYGQGPGYSRAAATTSNLPKSSST